jgi:exonuclease SbcD
MRIFHTADWHLGQTLHGFDREHEHNAFLTHLLALLEEHRPNALLVSGDIFDTINPSAQAQRTLFNFIHSAHQTLPTLQIILTAGNHDAAGRLEAPSTLLQFANTHVVGIIDRHENGSIQLEKLVIPLTDDSGTVQVLVLAIPFLRIADLPHLPAAHDPYLEGIAALYHAATQQALHLKSTRYPNARILAMGHGTVQAGLRSADSERPIVIGNSEELPPSTFPTELEYVALGHLHRPQSDPAHRLVYSGSPIPLSFSETDYRHRICQIDLLPNTPPALSEHRIPSLQTLPAADTAPTHSHPFLEVRILANQPDPARRKKIEDALANKAARLASIRVETPALSHTADDPFLHLKSLDAIERMDPLELMTSAHLEHTKTPPSPQLVAALNEVVSKLDTLPA